MCERICALVKLCILLSSISKLAYILVGKCLDGLLGEPPVAAVIGFPSRYWEAKLSAWTFIDAIEVKRCVVAALSWWVLIHCILMSMYSFLEISARSETISEFAGGSPWCLLQEMKSNLAIEAALLLHMYAVELVDMLWNSMNYWRKIISEASLKSSA